MWCRWIVPVLVAGVLTPVVHAQTPGGGAGVGVEAWTLSDGTRAYGASPARPIRVTIWYSAVVSRDSQFAALSTLAMTDWVSSAEATSGYDDPGEARRAFGRHVREFSASAPTEAATRQAFASPTASAWAARPQAGRHPAILLLSGVTARAYFHLSLAERLARAGYVVAHVLPLGPAPGRAASISRPDVEDAARDAAAVLDWLRTDVRVEGQRLGVGAWSVGGVAALRLLQLRPGLIGAAVSLDGAAGYAYGRDLLESSAAPSQSASRVAWLHLTAGVPNTVPRDESVLRALGAEIREAPGLRHADFVTVATLTGASRDAVDAMEGRVVEFLDRALSK
ncbi:MAG: dienelactone hydrolase family protein [Vicinamibacterales bacterium]